MLKASIKECKDVDNDNKGVAKSEGAVDMD